MTCSLPLLLLDVDGVLNPFAAPACLPGYREYDFFPGEEPVRLCAAHGPWLQELAARFQIVWATAWDTDANYRRRSLQDQGIGCDDAADRGACAAGLNDWGKFWALSGQ